MTQGHNSPLLEDLFLSLFFVSGVIRREELGNREVGNRKKKGEEERLENTLQLKRKVFFLLFSKNSAWCPVLAEGIDFPFH